MYNHVYGYWPPMVGIKWYLSPAQCSVSYIYVGHGNTSQHCHKHNIKLCVACGSSTNNDFLL